MKTPFENGLSLALTYSSGEQYSLSVARSAPPKLFSAGTPLGRGGRLDAHERRLYLISHLACEIADPRRDFQARAQSTRGESLALRRVIPSPKERGRTHIRSLKVCVKPLRISARKASPKMCSSYSKTLRISVRHKCTPPAHPISEHLYTGRSCAITLFLSRSCALLGRYTLALPHYRFVSSFHLFCQGTAPKKFACGELFPHTPSCCEL